MNIQVYTANVGEHDPPRKEEKNLVVFEENILGNTLLSARFYKACPHLFFPDVEWTIWIDANVWLKHPPEYYVNKCIKEDRTYGLYSHYFRNNAWEEYEAELEYGFDHPRRLRRTMERYTLLEKTSRFKSTNLSQNFFFVRKNDPVNTIRNNSWFAEISYGSRRDQLSLEIFYPGTYWPSFDFTKENTVLTRVDGEFIKNEV